MLVLADKSVTGKLPPKIKESQETIEIRTSKKKRSIPTAATVTYRENGPNNCHTFLQNCRNL